MNPTQIQQAMLMQNQLNIKPILQQHPAAQGNKKFVKEDVSPKGPPITLNIDSNRAAESKKKVIEPPKIATPSVEMYKGNENSNL